MDTTGFIELGFDVRTGGFAVQVIIQERGIQDDRQNDVIDTKPGIALIKTQEQDDPIFEVFGMPESVNQQENEE